MDVLQSFKKYLEIRGVNYQVDNNIVHFSRGGWNYMLIYDNEDPLYLRLALPRLEEIDEHFTFEFMRSVLTLSANYKVVKPVILDNHLWFMYEQFISEFDTSNHKFFDRAVAILSTIGAEWRRVRNPINNQNNVGEQANS